MDLTALQAKGETALMAALEAVDAGDVVAVANPPDWAGVGPLEWVVDGYTETVESHRRVVEFYGHPVGPYRVGVLSGGGVNGARLDAKGIILGEDVGPDETELDVEFPNSVPFSTTAVPYEIQIGPEVMTVTAATPPAGGGQVLTVVRGVNGVITSHAEDTEVHIYRPLRLAREG